MLWMAPTKFPMWKRDKGFMPCIVRVFLFVTVSALLLLVWAAVKPLTLCNNGKESLHGVHIIEEPITDGQATGNIEKFNCIRCPQAAPVVANKKSQIGISSKCLRASFFVDQTYLIPFRKCLQNLRQVDLIKANLQM